MVSDDSDHKHYELICFDMDGVIFEGSNFWMRVHQAFGTLEEGKRLTKKYLHSDYDRLVEEVVNKLWKEKDAKPYYDLINSINYVKGVKEVFDHVKKRGYKSAIISASSIDLAKRAQRELGIDFIFANELVIRDGKVSGEFLWPIGPGKHYKAKKLKELCSELGISTSEAIFVGDSDNDIEAFKEAGLSIAFNTSSEELKAVADVVINTDDLSEIIPFT